MKNQEISSLNTTNEQDTPKSIIDYFVTKYLIELLDDDSGELTEENIEENIEDVICDTIDDFLYTHLANQLKEETKIRLYDILNTK